MHIIIDIYKRNHIPKPNENMIFLGKLNKPIIKRNNIAFHGPDSHDEKSLGSV